MGWAKFPTFTENLFWRLPLLDRVDSCGILCPIPRHTDTGSMALFTKITCLPLSFQPLFVSPSNITLFFQICAQCGLFNPRDGNLYQLLPQPTLKPDTQKSNAIRIKILWSFLWLKRNWTWSTIAMYWLKTKKWLKQTETVIGFCNEDMNLRLINDRKEN